MKKVLLLFALLIGALSASAATVGDTYVKVTSTDDITLGDEYVISYNTYGMGSLSGKYCLPVADGVEPTIDYSSLTIKSTDVQTIKIVRGTTETGYAFELVGKNAYLTCTNTSNNSLSSSTTIVANANWSISFNAEDGSANIIPTNNSNDNNNKLQFNSNNNTFRFSNYKTGTQKNPYIYKKQVVLSATPTHVTFTPDGGVVGDDKKVVLKALDADNNEVDNATIYYKVGNGEEQNGKSPLTITLDAPATVEAWVADQETHNSATFTFPVVQPSAPVFKVNNEVLSGDDVTLPYGTKITISAENATSLEVDVNDVVTTVEGNSTTITITEDVIISVVAKNGELSTDEATILVTVKTPELTVKVGETVAENYGSYTIEQGTAIEVTATDAQSITILDQDGEEVTLQNNCFYPAENNHYTISAQAANKSADIEFDVVVTVSQQTEFTDVLTVTSFNVSGTTYKDVNYTSDASKIVYVGNIAGGNSAIQLRDEKNSGIVINANPNGYVLKQIVVDWNSNTKDSRQLDIYGADEAFEIAKMYDTKRPTKIVSLAKGETTFELTEDYSFIGLRSYDGAMYLNSITLVWEKKEYSAEGSISFGDAYSYDEYSTANVLTFNQPTIKFNGAPIEDGYGEYTVLLNGVELGQADQAISHFAPVNGADNKFQLRKGTKVIDVDVAWPAAINAKPAIKGVRYVQNDDNTLDAVYNIAPEDETPGYSWLVNVSNEGAELGWTENAATCTFKNVGAEAVNAPEKINAALVIPFAVKSTDGTAALAEGDEVYDVVEYSAPVVELSTAEVARPDASNTSGVADVAVDQNSAVEYYNLQGVRVNGDLTPGLYIRRQGNQATKVVVR